ncbi:MAG: YeeE/YedE thiosulfate transporter family protein, partial [Sulfitobacter sp.]
MIDLLGQPLVAASLGALGGILLGLAARLGRFCTLGAIEDALYGGSDIRLRMWGLAIGVAIFGTFGLAALGFFNLSDAFYLSVAFSWPAAIIGGLLFGYGMALAGNCGFGAIARLGGGDLRSFVIVLVMGLAAYSTLSGPFAFVRSAVFPRTLDTGTPDGIAHVLAAATGVPMILVGLLIGVLIIGAVISSQAFRRDRAALIWGGVVGIAIISGWASTAWIAAHGFAPQVLIS